ncbi:MAG TPA: sialidase family protein [Gemmatimonadaceae bacterium]|jgi:hypothetical protein
MTVRNVAALSALASLVASACIAVGQRVEDTATSCVGERWLSPHELRTPDGFTVFVAHPSITRVRGDVFIAGWPIETFDSLGARVWPLTSGKRQPSLKPEEYPAGVRIGKDRGVQLVPWPADLASGPWMPVATSDADGYAHVVWGSRDSVEMSSLFMVRSLWYSRFDGATLGPPARLLTTEGLIRWTTAQASPIVARDRSLHLMVGIQGEELRYVRFDGGAWTVRRVGIDPLYVGYPRLAVLSTGRVVLLIQGNMTRPPVRAIDGFFITSSDDGGRNWSPPAPISRVEDGPDFDGRLLVDDKDVVYAFWYQQTDASGKPAQGVSLGGSPGRIYATQSFDRGATWRRAMPTSLIANADELQVLLRPDHSVLSVLADGDGKRMLASTWSNGWSDFAIIDAKLSPYNPALGTDDAQRPLLTWGIRREPSWVGTMTTSLVPCH